jgi:hypothetical protein
MDRPTLEKAVFAAVESSPLPLRLYGSFGNRTFHLDESADRSFSDVDLFAEGVAERHIALFGPAFRRRVAAETGVLLRVSLRSQRLHARHLDAVQSYVVAVIEEGAKIETSSGRHESLYHGFKFLWRTAGWPVCYDAPFDLGAYRCLGIDEPVARALVDVKIGAVRPSPGLLLAVVERLREVAPRAARHALLLLNADSRKGLRRGIARAAPDALGGRVELLADCERKLSAWRRVAPRSTFGPAASARR